MSKVKTLLPVERVVIDNSAIMKGYCHCGCGETTEVAPRTDTQKQWVKGEPLRFVRGHSRRQYFTQPLPYYENTIFASSQNWDRERLAWLAGILEGEGSFLAPTFENGIGCGLVVKLGMTDEDVVCRCRDIIGYGTLSATPYMNDSGEEKVEYKWTVTRSDTSYAIMVALYSWMGSRRRNQIATAISKWLSSPRVQKVRGSRYCVAGHLIAGDNLTITERGQRKCRECLRIKSRDKQRRQSEKRRARVLEQKVQ